MKRSKWRRHHKWLGLFFSFFLLMFCISGIILNHRSAVAHLSVSRSLLPDGYHYKQWNNGLLRGTLPYTDSDSITKVLIYGNSGIWSTDRDVSTVVDFNEGLPTGADYRNIRSMAQTSDGELFALGPFGTYHRLGDHWQLCQVSTDADEQFSDIISHRDTLVVVGRSALYTATPPYRSFTRHELKAPMGYDTKVSLFKTIWLLHSGELFGIAGKLLMDALALIMILLCITGILYWFMPKWTRHLKKTGKSTDRAGHITRQTFLLHDKVGRSLIFLLLFITFTGWCLRPPILIAIAQGKVPAIPGTRLHSPNPWYDKLHMLRYDDVRHEWILSTSEGFYTLRDFGSIPSKISHTPPVSVMGVNVWEQDGEGNWLCGSFSGLFRWNRTTDRITDYFTGETAPDKPGVPFGKFAVSGYTADLNGGAHVIEYNDGTEELHMPESMRYLPMSLWRLSLEVHTGRIYTFLGPISIFFIFFAGLAALWILWSGYKLRTRRKKSTPPHRES